MIAIFVAGTSAFGNYARTIVWSLALAVMGTACIANAFRCERTHCYITGPFFLIMALSSLSIGLAPLGPKGWNLIGLTILVGAFSLCCLPEMFFGKDRNGRAGQANRPSGRGSPWPVLGVS
jgi:hypothetical protein